MHETQAPVPDSRRASSWRRSRSKDGVDNRAVIVTAWVHDDDIHPFHRLRDRFFPASRSFVSAHVTLFHHLPGRIAAEADAGIAQLVADFRHPDLDPATGVARVGVRKVFGLTRGVAYALERDLLVDLRERVRARFAAALKPQDARPWRNPHITVQNKVDPAEAARLRRHLARRFEPCALRVMGLQTWRYDGGPWAPMSSHRFAHGPNAPRDFAADASSL